MDEIEINEDVRRPTLDYSGETVTLAIRCPVEIDASVTLRASVEAILAEIPDERLIRAIADDNEMVDYLRDDGWAVYGPNQDVQDILSDLYANDSTETVDQVRRWCEARGIDTVSESDVVVPRSLLARLVKSLSEITAQVETFTIGARNVQTAADMILNKS